MNKCMVLSSFVAFYIILDIISCLTGRKSEDIGPCRELPEDGLATQRAAELLPEDDLGMDATW